MLIVISDVHFTDGTVGEHNLPYSAFESVFLLDVATLAKNNRAKEVKILLLGDILDVLRSSQWFDLDPADRPWGADGLSDVPTPKPQSRTERKALDILGQVETKDLDSDTPPKGLSKNTILHKNWRTFNLFRTFRVHLANQHGVDIPVEIIYIPGNHDRMCNLYPSLKTEIRKILGVTLKSAGPPSIEGNADGEWRYRNDFMDEAYGLYARHGHQYDTWNYSGNRQFDQFGHLKVPIGDIATTEFVVKIPWKLERLRGKYPAVTPELIENVKEIDYVRPINRAMEWIYYRIKGDSGEVRKALEETFDEVVKELLDIELVQQWRSPDTHVDEALRALSSRWLKWIPKGLVDLLNAEDILPLFIDESGHSRDPDRDPYTIGAYNELVWRANRKIRFIVYGHTHKPDQRPLDVLGDREIFYLNSGTWRPRMVKTVGLDEAPDFVGMKQMTYSVFYREDEDTRGKKPGTVSFDVRTGAKKKTYA